MINPNIKDEISRMIPDFKFEENFPLQVSSLECANGFKAGIGNLERLSKKSRQSQNEFKVLLQYIYHLLNVIHILEKERQQQQSHEAIVGESMLAGLVHDLRNPMAIMNSCAQFCLKDETLTPLTKEYLQMIQESGMKANKLLGQLVDFSKANLAIKTFDLNQMIHKAWRSAMLGTGYRGKFKANQAENLPEIPGDPEKLERVFLNIFLNAIQAVAQNHTEMIVTAQTFLLHSQNSVEVNVIDNGPGIAEEFREKIFTPLFTTKKEGTGLGLYLCQYFVRQHRGKIVIRRAPTGGTKVTIRLPLTHSSNEGD